MTGRRAMRGGVAAAAMLLAAGAAQAESLRDALAQTYRTNPTLTGQRARLRGTDEGVAIARAAGRPQISGTANFVQQFNSGDALGGDGRVVTAGPSVSVPLFSGGRVRNGVHAANARVDAGRADLRATEGDVFTEAVGAYMDVLRDEAVVELNRGNVKVLGTNLQASRDRFEVGDLTRTDVAQSEARLAGARSQLSTAEGQLTGSRENYRRVIGALPERLDPPPPLPLLPATPDDAVDIALANNPDLVSATAASKAAAYDVSVARADRLPTVTAIGSDTYTNYLGTVNSLLGVSSPSGAIQLGQTTNGVQVGVSATIPLYQGGLVGARVRQAQATESETLEQAVATERQVLSNTRAAYASLVAANQTITSSQAAVEANRLALEGVRAENSVGTRDVLDVLNAEQELLNSEVLLVTAQRDAYVAGFALINAMGQAEARDLGLDGGALYDPVIHYKQMKRSWSDWGDAPKPVAEATRTLDPPRISPVTAPKN